MTEEKANALLHEWVKRLHLKRLSIRPCCVCNYSERIIPVKVHGLHIFPRYKFRCDNCGNESPERKTLISALKRWNQENTPPKTKIDLSTFLSCTQASKEEMLKLQVGCENVNASNLRGE